MAVEGVKGSRRQLGLCLDPSNSLQSRSSHDKQGSPTSETVVHKNQLKIIFTAHFQVQLTFQLLAKLWPLDATDHVQTLNSEQQMNDLGVNQERNLLQCDSNQKIMVYGLKNSHQSLGVLFSGGELAQNLAVGGQKSDLVLIECLPMWRGESLGLISSILISKKKTNHIFLQGNFPGLHMERPRPG